MTVWGHVYPDMQPSGWLVFPSCLWLVRWHLWIAATVPSVETNNRSFSKLMLDKVTWYRYSKNYIDILLLATTYKSPRANLRKCH